MIVRELLLISSLQSRCEDPLHRLHFVLLHFRRVRRIRLLLWRGGLKETRLSTLLPLVEHLDALPHGGLLSRPFVRRSLWTLAGRGGMRIPLASCFLARIDRLIKAVTDQLKLERGVLLVFHRLSPDLVQ